MADWRLTPDGSLLNFDNLTFIEVKDDYAKFYEGDRCYSFDITQYPHDWRKFMSTLPERLRAEDSGKR